MPQVAAQLALYTKLCRGHCKTQLENPAVPLHPDCTRLCLEQHSCVDCFAAALVPMQKPVMLEDACMPGASVSPSTRHLQLRHTLPVGKYLYLTG